LHSRRRHSRIRGALVVATPPQAAGTMPSQESTGFLSGTGVEEKKTKSLWANVRSHAKSAKERFKDYVVEKESALNVAEENGIRSGKIMELMKAKAQSISSQVHGTVAASRSSSSRSRSSSAKPAQQREKSADRRAKPAQRRTIGASVEVPTGADEEYIAKICEIGVSPVAARLALSKAKELGAKKQHFAMVACNWLLNEENTKEVEAAENAEIERSAIAAAPEKSADVQEAPNADALPAPALAATTPPRAVPYDSVMVDDGRGLGFFMSRKSFPSPHRIPLPGRLSRGGFGKARKSTGSVDSDVSDSRPSAAGRVSIGSQASVASEEHHEEMPLCDNDADALDFDAAPAAMTPPRCQEQEAKEHATQQSSCAQDAACGDKQEVEEEESEGEVSPAPPPLLMTTEELEDEEEEVMAPLPPHSACWDWPLSRHEKKARVQMLEREIGVMDRKNLKQEVIGLRHHLRKASMGGSSQVARPSRLST